MTFYTKKEVDDIIQQSKNEMEDEMQNFKNKIENQMLVLIQTNFPNFETNPFTSLKGLDYVKINDELNSLKVNCEKLQENADQLQENADQLQKEVDQLKLKVIENNEENDELFQENKIKYLPSVIVDKNGKKEKLDKMITTNNIKELF